MLSVDVDLLLAIVNDRNAQLNSRLIASFSEMVEDWIMLKKQVAAKGNPSASLGSFIKLRGKYHEKYEARLPLSHLPSETSYQGCSYNLQSITKEYLNSIKQLEDALEK